MKYLVLLLLTFPSICSGQVVGEWASIALECDKSGEGFVVEWEEDTLKVMSMSAVYNGEVMDYRFNGDSLLLGSNPIHQFKYIKRGEGMALQYGLEDWKCVTYFQPMIVKEEELYKKENRTSDKQQKQ